MATGVPKAPGGFSALGPLAWQYWARTAQSVMTVAQTSGGIANTPAATIGAATDATISGATIDYPDTDDWRGIFEGIIQGTVGGLAAAFRWYGVRFRLDSGAPFIPSVTRVGTVYTFVIRAERGYVGVGAVVINGEFDGASVAGSMVDNGDGSFIGTFTRDLSTPVAVIRFEAVDAYGQRSAWLYFKLGPVAAFTYNDDEYPVVVLDAADSFDPDGSIDSWAWYFGGEIDTATGETASVDVEGSESEVDLFARLTVTDNDGLTGSTYQYITLQGIPRFDALTDVAGVRYSAVNTLYDNDPNQPAVRVYRFGETIASREDRALVQSLRHPSIWKDETDVFWIMGQTPGYVSSRVWLCGPSYDGGRRFIVANQVWGGEYFNAHAGPTPGLPSGGGVVSVAVKKHTDPAQLYFKRSRNGGNWPADADAVLVGTLPVDGRAARVYQEPGTGDILITNGIDKMWLSTDSGRIWVEL